MISFKPLFGYMAENNIKYKQLAEMLGCNSSKITAIKRNNKASMGFVDQVCTLFNIPIEEVIRYEKED